MIMIPDLPRLLFKPPSDVIVVSSRLNRGRMIPACGASRVGRHCCANRQPRPRSAVYICGCAQTGNRDRPVRHLRLRTNRQPRPGSAAYICGGNGHEQAGCGARLRAASRVCRRCKGTRTGFLEACHGCGASCYPFLLGPTLVPFAPTPHPGARRTMVSDPLSCIGTAASVS